ncbi:MAG: fibronectin type III domain-containing protein [Acidobacteriota bacterium]
MLDYIYFLDFDWTYHGIPVERAHLVFRLNHGNLVQMGEEYISSSILSLDPRPDLDGQTAWQILWGYLGGQTPEDEILEPGRLLVVPVSAAGSAENQAVTPGQGMGYRLVYVLVFRRHGVLGTWEARVDAHSGEILSFLDRNDYGAVTGGVYQTSNLDTETVRPLGFISVSNGTIKTCDAGGNYPYASGSATASLTGSYVKVVDSCGASSVTTSTAPGDLAFGASSGTDCTTPGFGGAGNTHAARTTYYHLTLWKEKAMAWLPSNTWLRGQLTDNVNLDQTCNAYWSGTSVNFFKSGGGCSNTGELPTVFLHEVGHGLDDNDGSPSSTVGSSESYADINALLMTHDSCIGVNFSPGVQCSGYGNPCTACTGIRDADYALHTYSTSPAVPAQLSASTGYHCSKSSRYPGPCGYEGHCESYIMSEVGWDLAARDLPAAGYDPATAWFIADRLFFLSRPSSGDAYSCPTLATANGCGTSNWYETYLAIDDDNGDLSDGTPHAAAIYAAFNRHAVACSTGSHTSYSTCPTLGQSNLSATISDTSVALSWTPIANAAAYEVYRNEGGASAGYAKLATINVPATTFTDTAVQNGITYYYRVLALGSSSACFGAMSAAVSAAPQPCTPPGAPLITSITDNDACAQSGIAVSYTAGSGATSHNLLKDGTVVLTGYSSGATYNPGDAVSHAYVVQAVNGACTTNSTGSSFADASGAPAAPAAPTVTDLDACALTGVQVSWGAVSGATGYDLQVDGGTLVADVATPYTRLPGDTNAHSYTIRAKTASCTGAWSPATSATDSNGLATPAAPTVADANVCAFTGVTITWSAVPSAGSYDLQVDGGIIVAGVSSPYLYSPGDSNGHGYAVRAVNGSCTGGWSGVSTGADGNATPAAPEAPTFTNVTSSTLTVSWTAVPGAGAYDLYRKTGGCGVGSVIASALAATTYNDSGLTGGTTYGYYLVAKAGACVSVSSLCATATTVTPPCATPPTFAGLTSVTPVSGATCSLQLAWSAGTSSCGGTITYNVYRSAGSAPVPPAGLLQSGLTGTTYTDANVSSGLTYTYIVQAVDSANGLNDGNTTAKSGTPGSPTTVTIYTNGFESGSGLADWTRVNFVSGGVVTDWRGIQSCVAHGGTHIFRFGGSNCTNNYGDGDFCAAVPSGATGLAVPPLCQYR